MDKSSIKFINTYSERINMEEIANMIRERNLKPSDCTYHTLRTLENDGKVRALVIKGEQVVHVEYICPFCGYHEYKTQEWKHVSKAAKLRFKTKCAKCGKTIKVAKLKGKK